MNTRYTFSPGSVAKIADSLLLPKPRVPQHLHHAPMQQGPVVRLRPDQRADIEMMRWGITLRWLPQPLIIARSETITTKPSCRNTFATSRCLVIADGFYECQGHGRAAHSLECRLPYDEPMVFAGIWATRPLREGGSHEASPSSPPAPMKPSAAATSACLLFCVPPTGSAGSPPIPIPPS
jgi:putative SOS response-associated peptidase YedK